MFEHIEVKSNKHFRFSARMNVNVDCSKFLTRDKQFWGPSPFPDISVVDVLCSRNYAREKPQKTKPTGRT